MKRLLITAASLLMTSGLAYASDAATSASAGSSRWSPNGHADATASYDGRVGFARTDARSGKLNLARGVAVGVDKDGLSLSISNAVAPRVGPALATNFNLTIDRDGDVSTSGGLVVANSPHHRSVTAGGDTGSGRGFASPRGTSYASGDTDRYGTVRAQTFARTRASADRPVSSRIRGASLARTVRVLRAR